MCMSNIKTAMIVCGVNMHDISLEQGVIHGLIIARALSTRLLDWLFYLYTFFFFFLSIFLLVSGLRINNSFYFIFLLKGKAYELLLRYILFVFKDIER